MTRQVREVTEHGVGADRLVTDPRQLSLNPTLAPDWFGALIVFVLITGLVVSGFSLLEMSRYAGEWVPMLFSPVLWWYMLGEAAVAGTEDRAAVCARLKDEPEICELIDAIDRAFTADVAWLEIRRVTLRFGRGGGHSVVWWRFQHVVIIDLDALAGSLVASIGQEPNDIARAIVLHEIAHVRGRDVWALGLTQLSFGLTIPAIALNAAVMAPSHLALFSIYLPATWLLAHIARRRESQADALAVFMQGDTRCLSAALQASGPGLSGHGVSLPIQRRFSRNVAQDEPEARSLAARLAAAWHQHFSPRQRARIVTEMPNFFLNLDARDMFAFGLAIAMPPCLVVALTSLMVPDPVECLRVAFVGNLATSLIFGPFILFALLRLIANCLLLSGEPVAASQVVWETFKGLLFTSLAILSIMLISVYGGDVGLRMVLVFILHIIAFPISLTLLIHFFIARCGDLRSHMTPLHFRRAAGRIRAAFLSAFVLVGGIDVLLAMVSEVGEPDLASMFGWWPTFIVLVVFVWTSRLWVLAMLVISGFMVRSMISRSRDQGLRCSHCGIAFTYEFPSVAIDGTVALDYLNACQECGRLRYEDEVFIARAATDEVHHVGGH